MAYFDRITLFEEFLHYCSLTLNNEEVTKFLKKCFYAASQEYIMSAEFGTLLQDTREKILTDPDHKYVHIQDFTSEVKAHASNHQNTLSSLDVCESDSSGANVLTPQPDCGLMFSTIKNSASVACPSSSSQYVNDYKSMDEEDEDEGGISGHLEDVCMSKCTANVNVVLTRINTESAKQRLKAESRNLTAGVKSHKASERQIRKLEKLLGRLDEEIRRLQQKELSLDDMNESDSYYLREEVLKKRFMKVWKKLCECKGRNPDTGRPTERRFRYQGSRYKEINRYVEKFITKWKVFPDFHDILHLIEKANAKYALGIGSDIMSRLAREVFTDVGQKLQRRRQEDFAADFGCFLTDSIDFTHDPALHHEELSEKLNENQQIGNNQMVKVIEKFSEKQELEWEDCDYSKTNDLDETTVPRFSCVNSETSLVTVSSECKNSSPKYTNPDISSVINMISDLNDTNRLNEDHPCKENYANAKCSQTESFDSAFPLNRGNGAAILASIKKEESSGLEVSLADQSEGENTGEAVDASSTDGNKTGRTECLNEQLVEMMTANRESLIESTSVQQWAEGGDANDSGCDNDDSDSEASVHSIGEDAYSIDLNPLSDHAGSDSSSDESESMDLSSCAEVEPNVEKSSTGSEADVEDLDGDTQSDEEKDTDNIVHKLMPKVVNEKEREKELVLWSAVQNGQLTVFNCKSDEDESFMSDMNIELSSAAEKDFSPDLPKLDFKKMSQNKVHETGTETIVKMEVDDPNMTTESGRACKSNCTAECSQSGSCELVTVQHVSNISVMEKKEHCQAIDEKLSSMQTLTDDEIKAQHSQTLLHLNELVRSSVEEFDSADSGKDSSVSVVDSTKEVHVSDGDTCSTSTQWKGNTSLSSLDDITVASVVSLSPMKPVLSSTPSTYRRLLCNVPYQRITREPEFIPLTSIDTELIKRTGVISSTSSSTEPDVSIIATFSKSNATTSNRFPLSVRPRINSYPGRVLSPLLSARTVTGDICRMTANPMIDGRAGARACTMLTPSVSRKAASCQRQPLNRMVMPSTLHYRVTNAGSTNINSRVVPLPSYRGNSTVSSPRLSMQQIQQNMFSRLHSPLHISSASSVINNRLQRPVHPVVVSIHSAASLPNVRQQLPVNVSMPEVIELE